MTIVVVNRTVSTCWAPMSVLVSKAILLKVAVIIAVVSLSLHMVSCVYIPDCLI